MANIGNLLKNFSIVCHINEFFAIFAADGWSWRARSTRHTRLSCCGLETHNATQQRSLEHLLPPLSFSLLLYVARLNLNIFLLCNTAYIHIASSRTARHSSRGAAAAHRKVLTLNEEKEKRDERVRHSWAVESEVSYMRALTMLNGFVLCFVPERQRDCDDALSTLERSSKCSSSGDTSSW